MFCKTRMILGTEFGRDYFFQNYYSACLEYSNTRTIVPDSFYRFLRDGR